MELIDTSFGYISAGADSSGFYHIFLENDHSQGQLNHVKIYLDPKLAAHVKNPARTLMGLLEAACSTQAFDYEKPLKIEYIPSTPLQKEGLRIQTASASVWTHVDDKTVDENRFWSPIEELIQNDHLILTPSSEKKLRQVDPLEKEVKPQSILKKVAYTHEIDSKHYGHEAAKQFPMLSSYIEMTTAQINSLERLLDRQEANNDDVGAELTRMQITFLEEKLELAKTTRDETGNEMVDSNYFRDLLKQATKEVANGRKRSELTQDEFHEIYRLACQRFIPSLCNCWKQEVQGQYPGVIGPKMGEKYFWMRFGAFYDTRCGLFSARDFFEADGKLKDDRALQLEARKALDVIERYNSEICEPKQPKPKFLKYLGLKEKPKFKQEHFYGWESAYQWICTQIRNPDGTINLDGLKKVLMERKAIQETNFLSLLGAQLGRLKPGDEKLQWLHVSLLKPFEEWKSDDIKGSPGWTHNEKHEILEMQWAFSHFRGAEISFDKQATAPFIEYTDDGKPERVIFPLHMAPEGYDGKPVKLESHFVSCSVAAGSSHKGHKNADGAALQGEINESFFNYAYNEGILLDRSNEGLKAEKDPIAALAWGESSFTAAEEISSLLLSRGWAISGCCQSGKDRTGFWCSRLAQQQVLEHYDAHASVDDDPSIRRCLNENPLNGKRVTTQILEANTGKTAVKVGVFTLPGEDPIYSKRLQHYFTLAYEQGPFQKKAHKVQAVVERNFTI